MNEYQLVIQLSGNSEEEFDDLIAIEDLLEENLAEPSYIDGHDVGSGEMNIFIITNDPESVFKEIKLLLPNKMSKIRSAYRDLGSDDYTLLWPFNLKEFKVA